MNYADLDALHAAIGDNRVSARAVAQRILRDLRGGVYEEQLPVTARQQPTAPRPGRGSAGRRLRRGPRRPHGAAVPVLHAGAR